MTLLGSSTIQTVVLSTGKERREEGFVSSPVLCRCCLLLHLLLMFHPDFIEVFVFVCLVCYILVVYRLPDLVFVPGSSRIGIKRNRCQRFLLSCFFGWLSNGLSDICFAKLGVFCKHHQPPFFSCRFSCGLWGPMVILRGWQQVTLRNGQAHRF